MNRNTQTRIRTSFILLFLLILMIKFNIISFYILIILASLSVVEFIQISKRIFNKFYFKFLSSIIFIIYLIFFCYVFVTFISYPQLKIIIYSLLFGCVASDIGGFIVGKILKGPKLTKISPNKTYSGAIGSIIFTCIVISSSLFFLTNNYTYIVLLTSVLISISCQIGDLFFSFLKRKAKLKDTGSFFPGHGGVLDRIDGILFGVPLGIIFLSMFS
mgnify:CR=1 FL=1